MPLTSFYTALTGLNNNGYALNVIGDNLANMNTTAFKSGTANFSELLAGLSGTSESGNPIVLGLGSTLNGVQRANTQGTITSTGRSTDAAINGNGFFVVDTGGGMGFTRAGNFGLDRDGNLISSDGYGVLGYMAVNGVVDSSAAVSPIVIKIGDMVPARATANLGIAANLDCQAADGATFATSVQVYDSLGAAHAVTLTFTKTGMGAWNWSATVPAADTGGAGDPVEVGNGAVTFDSAGKITSPDVNPTISVAGLASGAADMAVTINFLDPNGGSNITSYAGSSSVSTTVQDGYAASILTTVNIDRSGMIIGTTDSGQSINLAQLAMANFPNVDGLQKYKGSTFIAFSSSGEPSIGTAGTGGRGTIAGSSLEASNVDMAQEFVKLIVAQRAYQANSRVITTTDELYQDSLNLKR